METNDEGELVLDDGEEVLLGARERDLVSRLEQEVELALAGLLRLLVARVVLALHLQAHLAVLLHQIDHLLQMMSNRIT